MKTKQIIEVIKQVLLRNKVKLTLFLLTSCSGTWHYYIKTGEVCSNTIMQSEFNNNKGIKIDSVKKIIMKSNNASTIHTIINDSIHLFQYISGEAADSIRIYHNQICLDSLWRNFTNEMKENAMSHVYWRFSSTYTFQTTKYKYIYIELSNSLHSLREYYYPIVINTSNKQFYILPATLNMYISNMGDFNLDGILDYAEINDSLQRIEFFSLTSNGILINDSIYLALKPYSYPYWKIKHLQKNSSWWHKNMFNVSFKPH